MNLPSVTWASRPESRSGIGPRLHVRDLGLFALAILALTRPFWIATDPDYFWHLKTGELIVKAGGPPFHDTFSFTANGKGWLDHEWLSQVLIYGLHQTVGYAGSVLAFAAVGLCSVLLIYFLLRKLEVPELVALSAGFLIAVLSLPFWVVRPATFSILLTAIFLVSTYLYRRGETRRLWHLPVLMVLWANLHGGFVIGLGLIGLLFLVELVQGWTARARHVLIVGVLCLVAAGLNPYTYRLWIYPFTYFLGDNASLSLVAEWQSPPFFHSAWTIPLGLSILALVAIAGAGTKLDLWRTGLVLAFTALVLQSARHEADFALVAPVILAEVVKERWPGFANLPRRPVSGFLSATHLATALLLGVAAIALILSRGLQTGAEPRTSLASLPYPVEGAAYVSAQYPTARMFNEYAWGGYLIWALPQQKVFVDGRADLYGSKFLNDYATVSRVRPGWADVLNRYAIDLVIFEKGSPLASILQVDQGWRQVFTGPVEAVFVRSEPDLSVTKK